MATTAADFFTALAENDEKLASSLVKMNFEVEEGGKAGAAAEAAATTIRSSDEVIEKVKVAGVLAAEEATTRFATELGTAPGANNEAAATLLEANSMLDNYYREYTAAIDNIEKKGPPGLLRRFVNAKLQSKGISTETEDEFKARVAAEKIKATSGYIQTVNTLSQQAATTQKVITPTLDAAAAEATVAKVTATADLALQKQKVENARFNIAGLGSVLALEKDKLGNKLSALQVQEQLENSKLRREQLLLAREERQARFDAKKETEQDIQATLGYLRLGLSAIDSPQYSAKMDDKTLLYILRNKKEDPIVRTALDVGFSRAIGEQAYISDNAGVAAEIVVGSGARFGPDKSRLMTAIKGAYATAVSGSNLTPDQKLAYDPKDKNAVRANVSGYLAQTSERYHGEINPADSSNPYMAPALPEILQTPALREVKFVKENIIPLAENGMNRTDPDSIVNQGIEGVASGKLSIKEATFGINAIFNQATRINNATQEFSGFGWKTQTDYNALVTTSGGDIQKLDLTDPVAVQNYIMKNLAARRRKAETTEAVKSGYILGR